jgi:hypothetical protein
LAVSVQRVRHTNIDAGTHRRPEREGARGPRVPSHLDRNHTRFEPGWRPAPRRSGLEYGVLLVSAGLLVGAGGCFWLLYSVFGSPMLVAPPQAILQAPYTDGYAAPPSRDYAVPASTRYAVAEVVRTGKGDSLARSSHPMIVGTKSDAIGAIDRVVRRAPDARPGTTYEVAAIPAPARVQSVSFYAPERVKDREPLKEAKSKPLTRVAALESVAPIPRTMPAPMIPRIPLDGDPKTALIDFQTAPFPYEGHTSFRGRESGTYSDPHVLLHIPPGFDANKPAVMIVFFHGHGAILARDVRDRQQVPAQISESGVNAVLVAPQFAVDAADSNPGKFREPGGFKRFLDEAAQQLAQLHGDLRTTQVFANMPVVIMAYSGGFGPTLSVLDHGGIKPSRLRGIVLLDALYSGIDRFANWIAENRSAFFVSSYTPHTRHHNADLEQILTAKSVPYDSELRQDHLAGSVTFLPAGPISHRDFVTHAWADLPVKDILVRLEDYDPRAQTATAATSSTHSRN